VPNIIVDTMMYCEIVAQVRMYLSACRDTSFNKKFSEDSTFESQLDTRKSELAGSFYPETAHKIDYAQPGWHMLTHDMIRQVQFNKSNDIQNQ
jgi:hypothetical protein